VSDTNRFVRGAVDHEATTKTATISDVLRVDAQQQSVTTKATGAIDKANKRGTATLTFPAAGGTVATAELRFVEGKVFLRSEPLATS
jgi:polygalacturonase